MRETIPPSTLLPEPGEAQFTRRERLRLRLLMRVRPAPLAQFLKRLLRVRRRILSTPAGRFQVDPVSVFASQLMLTGAYEPELATTLRQRLRIGGTFLDLGANEGYFAVLAAGLVGDTGRVVAVEPRPDLAAVLRANAALNHAAVHVVEAAVTERDGTASFFLAPSTNTGASGLFRRTRYALPRVEVRTMTLASVLDETGLERVDLLKLDVEGSEYEILEGAAALLDSGRIQAVVLDLHESILRARGLDPGRPAALLRRAGFVPAPALPAKGAGAAELWVLDA